MTSSERLTYVQLTFYDQGVCSTDSYCTNACLKSMSNKDSRLLYSFIITNFGHVFFQWATTSLMSRRSFTDILGSCTLKFHFNISYNEIIQFILLKLMNGRLRW